MIGCICLAAGSTKLVTGGIAMDGRMALDGAMVIDGVMVMGGGIAVDGRMEGWLWMDPWQSANALM